MTDFFLIRKRFGAVYRAYKATIPFRCEISDKNAVFIDYYRLIRDKITEFYVFYLFYTVGTKIAIKIGESCEIERIAARSERAARGGFRELQKHLEVYMNELALFNSFFNHALNDTVGDFNLGTSFNVPKVDVKETKDAYTLEMDLPGMNEKDVNVELDHNVLTISSHHEEKKEEQNKNAKKDESKWLIRERRVSEFSRRFTLPDDVNGEQVAASFKNGVLTVAIPRKALSAPKRIAISAD